jgi:hypothetical protein
MLTLRAGIGGPLVYSSLSNLFPEVEAINEDVYQCSVIIMPIFSPNHFSGCTDTPGDRRGPMYMDNLQSHGF